MLMMSKDWNPMTKEEAATADATTAYCCSKALAERTLWDFMESENPQWDAVSVNPPWVFGPRLDAIKDLHHLNESTKLIWELLDSDKVPPVDFAGNVDARMLADAHVSAFETPEASNRRFLVGTRFSYQTAVDILRQEFPELQDRLPVGEPGSGRTQPMYKIDNSTAEEVLGIKHTPLEQTLKETMVQLLEAEKSAA
jgi:nucleoside-diphosphate-sugar epimerase